MKKFISILILLLLFFSLFFVLKNQKPIDTTEYIDYEDLSTEQAEIVDEAVSANTVVESAEIINDIDNESAQDIAVHEVLDNLYTADEVDSEAVEDFSNALDEDISETLTNYEEAREERDNADNLDYVTGTVVIEVDEDTDKEELDEYLRSVADDYEVISDDGTLIQVDINADQTVDKAMSEISESDMITDVDKDNIGQLDVANLTQTLTDTSAYLEWYLDDGDFATAWNYIKKYAKSNSVKIGVIDSCFNLYHNEIKNSIISYYDPTNNSCTNPIDGHGTMVSGVLGATTNDYTMAGAASTLDNSCQLIVCKIQNENGALSDVNFYKGVQYAIKNGAQVITTSISWSCETSALIKAIKLCKDNDIPLLASAGNQSSDTTRFPAGDEDVISVGATNDSDDIAYFSNYGDTVDIYAPGTKFILPNQTTNSSYSYTAGTSFSAPLTASVVGLMLRLNPDLTVAQVRQYLCGSTYDVGEHTWKVTNSAKKKTCALCGVKTTVTWYACQDDGCTAYKYVCSNCGCRYHHFDKFNAGLLNAGRALKYVYQKTMKEAEVIKYYPQYKGSSTSLIVALNSLGIDSSKENRSQIAKANGIANYTYSASQNTQLLALLKEGKLRA